MAQDLEQLVLSISADTRQIQRALKKLETDAGTSTRNIEKKFDGLGKNINNSLTGLGKGLFGSLAGAFSVREAQKLIDSATRIDNALKVAGVSGAELSKVYDSLFASAQRNAAPLEALVTLYGRAAMVQKDLGVSTQDLLKFTDNIALALRVSGKSAQESSGALLQLSQALGSGVVRAQEFNSMLEGALPIVQAAANGIEEAGGSVSKLRTLVNDGKVSSEAFFKGFQAGADILNQQVAGASYTVAQGFERLQNALIKAAGDMDKLTNTSKGAVTVLDSLTGVVERLPDLFRDASRGVNEFNDYLRRTGENPGLVKIGEFLRDHTAAGKLMSVSGRAVMDTIGPEAQKARAELAAQEQQTQDLAKSYEVLGAAMRNAGVDTTKGKTEKNTGPDIDKAFAAFAPKKISLKDFAVPGKDKKSGDSKDTFERSLDSISKRIAVMDAETKTIDQNSAARERAKVVAELEAAAKRANEAAGLKNTEVTTKQREQIDKLADSMYRSADAAEAANAPLKRYAREAANLGDQLQSSAVTGLRGMEDALIDVVSGTKSAADAFKSMANAILSDLARIAIRQSITGPIGAALGGLFGGGGGAGAPLSLIPKFASGTDFAPGGMALVGERGPELLNIPRGGQVVPNDVLRRGGGAVSVQVINQTSSAATPDVQRSPSGDLRITLRDAVRGIFADDVQSRGPMSQMITASGRGFGGR